MELSEIKFFNRSTNQFEVERVYGDALIKWLYGSNTGKTLSGLLCRAPLSIAYGAMQSSKILSRKKVRPFINDFSIDMNEYEVNNKGDEPFDCFNDFFIRKFKVDSRPFISEDKGLGAFSEGRYLGFESIHNDLVFPVKGEHLTAKQLLSNDKWNQVFTGGPLVISRLCPVDYHRFHFPTDVVEMDHYRIKGKLHSVNPWALKMKSDILCTNERHVTILNSETFGQLAYIEVGAICVGKIVQTANGKRHQRGDEKGYFLFGGSTVICLGEKGRWQPSLDILENTSKNIETYLKLGDQFAF